MSLHAACQRVTASIPINCCQGNCDLFDVQRCYPTSSIVRHPQFQASTRLGCAAGTLHAAEDWASKKMHLDLWRSGKSPEHTGGSGGDSGGSARHGKIAAKAGSGSGSSGSKFMPLDGGDYELDRWGDELRAFSSSRSSSSSNVAKTGGGSGSGSGGSLTFAGSRSGSSGSGGGAGGGSVLNLSSFAAPLWFPRTLARRQ